MFKIAYEKGSAEEDVFKRWLGESSHAPSDDLNQPGDNPSAALDRPMAVLLERIANRDAPPLERAVVLQAPRAVTSGASASVNAPAAPVRGA